MRDPAAIRRAEGGLSTAAAFVLWGLLPVYWEALRAVGPLEIIVHRVVWSLVFTAILLSAFSRWGEIGPAFRSWRTVARLLLSAGLLSVNWLIYVWAIASGHVLDASLGYFINPLLNVALGVIVFSERLNSAQWIAVSLVAAGVVYLTIATGSTASMPEQATICEQQCAQPFRHVIFSDSDSGFFCRMAIS